MGGRSGVRKVQRRESAGQTERRVEAETVWEDTGGGSAGSEGWPLGARPGTVPTGGGCAGGGVPLGAVLALSWCWELSLFGVNRFAVFLCSAADGPPPSLAYSTVAEIVSDAWRVVASEKEGAAFELEKGVVTSQ